MAEASARRQFVDEVLADRRASSPAPEAAGTSELARPGIGHDYMLELRFKDGRSTFLDYTYLPRCDYDPQTGIRLRFATCDVRIVGTNLRPLLEEIVTRKRRYVEENTNAARLVKLVDAQVEAPFVSEIVVEDEEESRGANRTGAVQR